MNRLTLAVTLVALAVLTASALPVARAAGSDLSVTVNEVDTTGTGAALGTVRIEETSYGIAFHPQLKGLPPGLHGFHVHENPSCAAAMEDGKMVAAKAAGGHLDPASTKRHGHAWGDGHLGDLPALVVLADGTATTAVLAPRLRLADVKGRALMVHVGGDNHADEPEPLGGGGGRMACGVIR